MAERRRINKDLAHWEPGTAPLNSPDQFVKANYDTLVQMANRINITDNNIEYNSERNMRLLEIVDPDVTRADLDYALHSLKDDPCRAFTRISSRTVMNLVCSRLDFDKSILDTHRPGRPTFVGQYYYRPYRFRTDAEMKGTPFIVVARMEPRIDRANGQDGEQINLSTTLEVFPAKSFFCPKLQG